MATVLGSHQRRGEHLLVDTATAGRTRVAVLKDGRVLEERQTILHLGSRAAGFVARAISPVIRGRGYRFVGVAVIRGIAGRRGRMQKPPAGFSQLRAGLVTANALAYAMGIPVVGVTMVDSDWDATLASVTRQLARALYQPNVSPVYGKAPHITTPVKCNKRES